MARSCSPNSCWIWRSDGASGSCSPIQTKLSGCLTMTSSISVIGTSASLRPCAYATEFTMLIVSRSEEHTSELQSRPHLVCRLLLEKKKKKHDPKTPLTSVSHNPRNNTTDNLVKSRNTTALHRRLKTSITPAHSDRLRRNRDNDHTI